MLTKHLVTLELPKILERLASHCAFSASESLARALEPSTEMAEVTRRLAETTQAKDALEKLDLLDVGGARDIRARVDFTNHGGVLEPQEFLTIRDTLEAGKRVQRALMRYNAVYPQLTAITNLIEPCAALVNEINRCVDDGGEVRDNASPALASARREVRIVHDRLLQKLQRMVADTNTATYLMESLVTQRGGRYVIPVRADFKGRIPGVVHDQSSSGQTLFIEPLATLDLNNEWRELQLAEARERLRVLTALSAQVSADSELISRTIDCLAQFDLALAKAKYSEATRGTAAEIVSRDKTPQGEAAFMLRQSRHPLLNMDTAVPIDVHLGMKDEKGESARVLVITGPNTGGKTVALKTVGLLALMNQCGLHIPAEQARLPVFEAVYADIGDEQSIEQSLSTFSSHLTNLVAFLPQVTAQSLVLLDELGAGTDPVEGAALARAILEYLLQSNALCATATHYPELKAWAYLTDGAVNANVAFDHQTLRPLYKLTVGLPGRSNAFAIARRLGLKGEILDVAEKLIDDNHARTEDMLAEIARMYRQAEAARNAARRAENEAEKQAGRMKAQARDIESKREEFVAQAKEDAEREVENLRAEIRKLRARVVAAGGALSLEEVKQIEKDLQKTAEDGRRKTEDEPKSTPSVPRPLSSVQTNQSPRPLRVNDTVRVRSLNANAVIGSITGDEAEVQIGRMRMKARLSDLERVRTAEADAPEPAPSYERFSRPQSPGMELDMRGMMTDEGVTRVEEYLDRAARAGLPFVRIIHGKGTGALRRAVRDAIKSSPFTKSFETGQEGEGGDGVTVVKLKEG